MDFSKSLFNQYHRYKTDSLTHRRFRHKDIVPLITDLGEKPEFTVELAGLSVEKREIYHIRWGNGPAAVCMWSQMHGDESTATMALFDLFRFLAADDEWNEERRQWSEQLSLHVIPMLNPDGAELFTRRNAHGIDINRDALKLVSPESKILHSLCSRIQPDFAFNLHDQNIHTSVGATSEPAAISFLAPPVDDMHTVTPTMDRAVLLIARLNRLLSTWIPGKIGRYSDAFEPRAFGETIQQQSISTILIESGGYPGDPEKQFIRKLNFLALAESLFSIGGERYRKEQRTGYYQVPENGELLFDLIIRGIQYRSHDTILTLDIGINREEITVTDDEAGRFFYRSFIADLGDLSPFSGYETIDGSGLILESGKVYPKAVIDGEVDENRISELLKLGYTDIYFEEKANAERYTGFPVNIHVSRPSDLSAPPLSKGGRADFILKRTSGITEMAVVNGFVFDLIHNINEVKNALVY